MPVMIQGEAPEGMCDILNGASLTAFRKKDGGIPPIAIGNTFRRLTSKIVNKTLVDPWSCPYVRNRWAVERKAVPESAVHASRCFVDEVQLGSRVLLKLDFKNAFDTIHRHVLLQLF